MYAVGLIPNWHKQNTAPLVERITAFFEQRQIPLLKAGREETDLFSEVPLSEVFKNWRGRIELIIVIGGDGTILRVARDLSVWGVPILGINTGRKGFLAQIEVEYMESYLQQLVAGQYDYSCRMMLEAVVQRGDRCLGRFIALNDVVVSRGPFSRIIKLDTYIDEQYLESYTGDGVIVATPTGSTGYSLSTGGPIVNPDLHLIVITPICPHSLYNRAVIVTADEKILMRVDSHQAQVVLTVDGQVGYALEDGDEVVVGRSAVQARLVRFADHSFYRLLHQKLKG